MNWAEYDYEAPHTSTAIDPLVLEVGLACDYVAWVSGRPLDATMPPALERAAQKAVVLRTIQQVIQESGEQQEDLFAGTTLKGFSVTGYAEQYVEVGEAEQAHRKGMMINPQPELNRLLWMLVTPQQLGWWRAFLSEGGIPAYGVVEMDWSGANRYGGYAGIMEGGLPGDYPGYGGLEGEGWPGLGAWPAMGSYPGMVLGGGI
jgi:hypothetical protein